MNYISSRWGIGTLSFLSGLAIGIAGGLLWAPQSGRHTREDLQDLAADALEEVEHWTEKAKEHVEDLYEKTQTAVKVG